MRRRPGSLLDLHDIADLTRAAVRLDRRDFELARVREVEPHDTVADLRQRQNAVDEKRRRLDADRERVALDLRAEIPAHAWRLVEQLLIDRRLAVKTRDRAKRAARILE